MGLRQPRLCPFGTQKSAAIRRPLGAPLHLPAHPDSVDDKMHLLRPPANGRIARSPEARRAFQASHPCPATGKTSGPCKGYVIDHIKPLKRGGADAPGNMQWQTRAAASDKDKIE